MASAMGPDSFSPRKRPSRRSIATLQTSMASVEEDKENMTTDVAAIMSVKRSGMHLEARLKRSRSKSLGPGGLDALTNATFNERKAAMKAPIKSILKPTLPLSPLGKITQDTSKPGSGVEVKAGKGNRDLNRPNDDGNLPTDLAESNGGRSRVSVSGAESLCNPFESVGASAKDEGTSTAPADTQHAVTRDEHVEEMLREKQKKEILERREARRKSMANRRVSFAPEATLHTWHDVELVQDSTTSSASTSSNRRASSMTGTSQAMSPGIAHVSPARSGNETGSPSTPSHNPRDESTSTPPTRNYVETRSNKRRRRSSGATSVSDDDLSGRSSLSSPFSGSSAVDSDDTSSDAVSVEDADGAIMDESGEGDSTSMSLVSVDMTVASMASAPSSNASTASTGRLNEALRRAAAQAGTRGIEYDENGDLSMEIAEDQVTEAFQAWSKGRMGGPRAVQDLTSFHDQENQNPFGAGPKATPVAGSVELTEALEEESEATMEMTMDMTRPVGRIVSSQQQPHLPSEAAHHRLDVVGQQRASPSRRESAGEGSSFSDATMDLTAVIGGIQGDSSELPETVDAAHDAIEIDGEADIEEAENRQHDRLQQSEPQHLPSPSPSVDPMETSRETDDASTEKISLQEFLELTNIQFMDLTTTKRRRTMNSSGSTAGMNENSQQDGIAGQPNTLAHRVRAASCTLPMLELYQHSCHELKKYISEGRSIIRRIEVDTSTENPGLFREYLTASPDVRFIMENQFKNVKTHSRLSSKGQWYEWRKKLLDDLKQGLLKIEDGMIGDDEMLSKRESFFSSALPALLQHRDELEREEARLRDLAEENAQVDQAELAAARDSLLGLEEETEAKQALLESLQMEIREKQEAIENATERKLNLAADIAQAEKIKEGCRGWNTSELKKWKALVDGFEKTYGWTIIRVNQATIHMRYQRHLDLALDLSSRCSPGSKRTLNATASLNSSAYEGDSRTDSFKWSRDVHEVFIEVINEQLRTLQAQQSKPMNVLKLVSDFWCQATSVAEDIRLLKLHYPSDVIVLPGNGGLAVNTSLLLPSLRSKVKVTMEIAFRTEEAQVDRMISVTPRASVVYGERFDKTKMQEFLQGHIHRYVLPEADSKRSGAGRWVDAVKALSKALVSRGRMPS